MGTIRLWLDDERPMPGSYDIWVRRPDLARFLIENGWVGHISFDHDLGGFGDGYEVAVWLEELAHTRQIVPTVTWDIHSANPVGSDRIRAAMESYDRALQQAKDRGIVE